MARKTGMTRPVDELGRVVIPMEIRKSFNIVSGARLDISVSGKSIILTPREDGCVVCGRIGTKMYRLGDVRICEKCYKSMEAEDDGCEI